MYYNTHNIIYIILEYKSYNNIQNISVGSLITCITIHTIYIILEYKKL